jgi:hypothetical protein
LPPSSLFFHTSLTSHLFSGLSFFSRHVRGLPYFISSAFSSHHTPPTLTHNPPLVQRIQNQPRPPLLPLLVLRQASQTRDSDPTRLRDAPAACVGRADAEVSGI